MDAYNFHHSVDFLILRATEKILKTKSLEKSKQHFYYDFSNDIGIINLLRQTYLKDGELKDVFELYQNSRLEPKSHRYESLIATLILTIVGNIISGILLDTYKSNKDKIKKIFDEKILSSISNIPDKIKNKFLIGNNENVKVDLDQVINCYIARLMNERQLIDLNVYNKLVDFFIYNNSIDNLIKEEFDNFKINYLKEDNCINIEKLFNIIEGYSRGVYLKYLDESGCEIMYFENIQSSNQIKGTPASNGFCKGVVLKINNLEDFNKIQDNIKFENKILCFGGSISPDKINHLFKIKGLVTWNTGRTGHLPVISRSIGIPCVIIDEADALLLNDNDDIIVSGGQGLVYTGIFAM